MLILMYALIFCSTRLLEDSARVEKANDLASRIPSPPSSTSQHRGMLRGGVSKSWLAGLPGLDFVDLSCCAASWPSQSPRWPSDCGSDGL